MGLSVVAPTLALSDNSWFPFSPASPVAAGSAVDASNLLIDYPGQDVSRAIDSRGHLYAGADGHFYFTATGKRAKFFGLNFMVNTIFPPFADAPQQPGEYQGIVPPDAADQLAVRLARMGVNVVRLHFIDGGYARPVSIWDPAYPNDTKHFDALQVSRLDYLIYSLKKHGIYCDINLHAGRLFRSEDGVPDYALFGPTSFNKPATEFDPLMIQLQQQYAAQLLTHVNPYTHFRLADDPAIAFVEISNEDTLLFSFASDQLAGVADAATCYQGMSCGLPPSYSRELDGLWNSWLKTKYINDAALSAAWAPPVGGVDAMGGAMTLVAPNANGWTPRYANGAGGTVSSGADPTSATGSPVRVDVQRTGGVIWGIQLDRSGLSLQNGQLYDLSISLKGTSGAAVRVDLVEDQSPFSFYQVAGAFNASSTWRTMTTTFQANATNTGHVQMNLDVSAAVGTVWIDHVSLTPHGASGLMTGESLAQGSVVRQTKANLSAYSLARNQDLQQFYYETQQAYFDGMNGYLRNTLGVKSMMTGSAVFGLPLNADLASHQDFVDQHIYGEYPSLTNTADAFSTWTIQNKPFSADPLYWLFASATQAVQGKPFTVTESDQPFPNDYAVEWLPWMTTFANFQDWDALMPKMYGNWPDNYFAATPPGWQGNHFFAIGGNPIAAAQFPVASRVFLGSQNTPAAEQITLQANRTDLMQDDPGAITAQFFGANGYTGWQALVHSMRSSFGDSPSSRTAYVGDAPPVVVSDHGELTYDRSDSGAPVYKVSSPYLQAATGFLAGKTITMPNLSVTVSSSTAAFGSITLQPVDGQPLMASKRLLLSVMTRYENTGMIWNATRTSLGENWGTAPALVEPLAATFNLQLRPDAQFAVYALDAQGNRAKQVGWGVGNVSLSLNTGTDATVWYELTARVPSAAPVANQLYYLVAQHSGRCLDVRGGTSATQDGVPLQQWTCWGGDNQKWKVISGAGGRYDIVSQSSGKSMDVMGGVSATANGVPVQQWTFEGGANQLWSLAPSGAGFQVVAGNSGRCLDVTGGAAALENGVAVQQWDCVGGSNQIWQFIPAQ